ncbi:Mu transposase domain-containing protein [Skermanella mucosa]|uniref:Mu transposase domain-containing protein n=1 Tax=Skermanella mucosa TaxID=1789672 RepID=UPI00389AE22A
MIGRWFRYKLAPDYHVSIEGVAYSVPYRLIGRHVDVFCTVSLVSIFQKGQRVAAHARQDAEPGRATVTLDEHRPPNHRAAVLLTPETVRAEAAGLGGTSGCWPTGSSPMPIISTKPRVRSLACCDWAGCTAPWLCRPPRRQP